MEDFNILLYLGFANGGLFTFPKSTIIKNQLVISGTKRNMTKKFVKSDRPTYNSNRIVNKRQEGGELSLNSFEFILPTIVANNEFSDIVAESIKSVKEDDLSDIRKRKSFDEIMEEVRLPIVEELKLHLSYQNNLQIRLASSINKYLGIPYLFGGKTKTGIDCSGFTSKVMQDMGIKLTGGTINQWKQVSKIGVNDLKVGDLVFLKGTISGRQKDLPSHVAIVTDTSNLSNGKIKVAEASGRGKTSKNGSEWDLTKGYYKEHWLGAGRVFQI